VLDTEHNLRPHRLDTAEDRRLVALHDELTYLETLTAGMSPLRRTAEHIHQMGAPGEPPQSNGKHTAVTCIAQFIVGLAERDPVKLAQFSVVLAMAEGTEILEQLPKSTIQQHPLAKAIVGPALSLVLTELRVRYGVRFVSTDETLLKDHPPTLEAKARLADQLTRQLNARRNEIRRQNLASAAAVEASA